MEKKKDKKKKISSLEATGHLQPGPARTSPAEWQRQPWQPELFMYVHPSQVGGGQSSFLHSRDKSGINSGTKNLSFLSLCSVCPPPSSCPPGACTSLPAPGPEACPPSPSPQALGDALMPKDAFCQDGCTTPLSSCFLCVTLGLQASGKRLPILRGAGRRGGQSIESHSCDGEGGGGSEVISGGGTKVRSLCPAQEDQDPGQGV